MERRSHKQDFLQWAEGSDFILGSLEGCPLEVGDIVTFTNDYGVEFHGREVLGICSPEHAKELYTSCDEIRVYIDSDSYWCPKKLSQLTKEN